MPKKLIDTQIIEIRQMYADGYQPHRIAEKFNITPNYVWMIARGHDRADAGGIITKPREKQ